MPGWVLRFDPGEVERWLGPDPGPDDEFLRSHGCQVGTRGSVEKEWLLTRMVRARRVWRDAAFAWWRENAPTHPRAPWPIRREATRAR